MINRITVNEQSSIRIEGEKILRFDPFNLPDAPHDADIIFITHDHFDHYSPEDISKAAKSGTLFAAPESMKKHLTEAGITNVTCLKPGDRTSLLGFDVEAVPAYNTLKPFHPKRNGWLGYVVTVEGTRIYVCGDTDATPEARAVKCDIICVPIGGTFTMNPKKAAEFVNEVKPAIAVPIHYGTAVGKKSDADEFEKGVDSSVQVVRKLFV